MRVQRKNKTLSLCFKLYMYGYSTFMYVCALCVPGAWRPEEAIKPLGPEMFISDYVSAERGTSALHH